MRKTVGKPRVSKIPPTRPGSFKPNPSKTLRTNAKKAPIPKRPKNTRTYSGPTDYESYIEPNGLGTGNNGAPEEADRAAAPGQGFSILSMFGGIDGIIGMMTKANQVFKLFQQMGPMFKLIGSFASAKAATASLKPGTGRKRPRHRKPHK